MGEGAGEGAGEAAGAASFPSPALALLWFLSSGPAALEFSFASSFFRTRPLGDAVVPRGDGGLGGRAWPGPGLGQGEAGLCHVEGEDGRVLDLGLSSEAELPAERRRRGEAGRDCRFLRLRSRARALFSFSFSRSLSFFSFFCPGEASVRLRARTGLPPALGLRRSARSPGGAQRCPLRGALEGGVRGLAEAERGHRGTAWSRPLRGSVTALRLRARKERVGVIRRSTMLLSQALSCRLRSGAWEGSGVRPELWWGVRLGLLLLLLGEFQSVAEDFESRLLIIESTCLGRFTADTEHLLPLVLCPGEPWCRAPAQDQRCCRISAHVFFTDLWMAAS